MSLGRQTLADLLELIAPRRCPGCDLAAGNALAFCAACAPLLDRPSEAHALPGPAAAAFAYGGPLADALCRLKYENRTELAPVLGALLADAALAFAGSVDRVLPMPLHPTRLRARGFNQAALLARPVAAALGVPLDTRSLRRIRATAEQAGLERDARTQNVRGAFACAPLDGVRALIVDDVRTTGATLTAAAEAVLAAGAREAHTLALARAGS
jgi:ComF family protein